MAKTEPTPEKKSNNVVWIVAIIAGAIVICCVSIFAIPAIMVILTPTSSTSSTDDNVDTAEEPLDEETPETTATAETVDMQKFIDEFDENSVAAETKWKGKLVKMTGYVGNIDEGLLGETYVILNPVADEYYFGTAIQCYFESKESVTNLKKGQKVTLQGEVGSESIFNISINKCSVL